eukprot:9329994-Alexandrium_andersonii.AAC.1
MGERIFVRGARTPLEVPQCLDDALAGRLTVQLSGEVACHRGAFGTSMDDSNQQVAEVLVLWE